MQINTKHEYIVFMSLVQFVAYADCVDQEIRCRKQFNKNDKRLWKNWKQVMARNIDSPQVKGLDDTKRLLFRQRFENIKKYRAISAKWSHKDRMAYKNWWSRRRYANLRNNAAFKSKLKQQRIRYRGHYKDVRDNDPYSRYRYIYMRGAKRRGLAVEMTFDDFLDMYFDECFYCGTKESKGVDRICSSSGYIEGNCVPCCSLCNRMKLNYSIDEFLDHIVYVCKPRQHKNQHHTALTYGYYMRRSAKKGLTFELSRPQFKLMQSQACHYCLADPAGGIDRVINDVGYIPENCVPCCKLCNYMKRDYDYHEFKAKCKQIAAKWQKSE